MVDAKDEEEGRPQPVIGVEQEDVFILVVGVQKKLKRAFVKMLTENGEWEKEETPAKVRIYTGQDSPRRVVVDTTPLRYKTGKSPSAIAEQWISENSLRRIIVGKFVLVVCVVSSCIVTDRCYSDTLSNEKCWLDVLQLIFGHHNRGIMVLAKTDDDDVQLNVIKSKLKHFVTLHGFMENVIVSSFTDGARSVVTFLDGIAGLLRDNNRVSQQPRFCSLLSNRFRKVESSLTPFRMEEVTLKTRGPWALEKVILFGMTGSGKSTLAQMLTTGTLDPDSKVFRYSSGAVGGTAKIEKGSGRGWYVVDTPGVGEPKGNNSTIESDKAEATFKKYVKIEEGLFAHYIFVKQKEGRVNDLEQKLWKFFKSMFGKEISTHVSIVISGASPDWLEKNMSTLQKSFDGCSSFLCAEFPETENGATLEVCEEYEQMRTDSLTELEYELAKRKRCNVPCKYGKLSRENLKGHIERSHYDTRIEKDSTLKSIVETSNVWFEVSMRLQVVSLVLFGVDDEIHVTPVHKL